MPTPEERIIELEKEVKALTRLVREMAAREKVITTRLQLTAKDAAESKKKLDEFDKISRKMDHRILTLQSKLRYSG